MAKNKFLGGAVNALSSKWAILGLLIVFIIIAVVVVNYTTAARVNAQQANVANQQATVVNVPTAPSVASVPNTGNTGNPAYANFPTGKFFQPRKEIPYVKPEGFTSSSPIQVMFFNVDWCPHCVRAKPEWSKFVQNHSSDSNITFVGGEDGTNCTNNDDSSVRDLVQKYNIQHFPTVIFVKDGTPTEFQGKVTSDNLESFLSSF